MKWKSYNLRTAPKQKLTREPLPGRQYCSEKLDWTERAWTAPELKGGLFAHLSREFYRHLYRTLTAGTPLAITPEQVRQQIAVIEECHRQNPLSRLDGRG